MNNNKNGEKNIIMEKTKEELNTLKTELETLEKKTMELNEEEFKHITGGMISTDPLYEMLRKHAMTEREIINNSPLLPKHRTHRTK